MTDVMQEKVKRMTPQQKEKYAEKKKALMMVPRSALNLS